MNCRTALRLLNDYLDDSLTWKEAVSVEQHLGECSQCARQCQELQSLMGLMRSLRRLEPPAELSLRVKIEASKQDQPFVIERIASRLAGALRPVAIPAFSGVVLTFLFFVVLMSTFLPGGSVNASNKDVPLSLFTEPRANSLYMSQFVQLESFRSVKEPITVEAHVNNDGRVVEYKILSGPRDDATVRCLDQFFFFEVRMSPATFFGRPTSGNAALTLIFYPIANDRIDVPG